MSTEKKPKSTIVILTREKFEAIPNYRATYIGMYVLIFAAWAIATFGGLYYERVSVPIPKPPEGADQQQQPAADTADEAEDVPQTRIEYRWRWTPSVKIFEAAMILGMLVFYVYFIRVLALMGYPLPMILGYCAAVFLPVPGMLAVALIDRQVAKTWNKADDVFQEADRLARRPATEP